MSASHDFKGRWYHLIATVYGAWLPGDPRGFRTRHHREHVEGDYKQPPPTGLYAKRLLVNQSRLKQAPVVVRKKWRSLISNAFRRRLVDQDCFVLCLSMSGQHLHVLAKLPSGMQPRAACGRAKKHSAFEAKANGWTGKLWGRRGKEIPIRGRAHQVNTYHYVLAHESEGAWVWKWSSNKNDV